MRFITSTMDPTELNETFRKNLLAVLKERNLTAKEVSLKAGLNERAVKDIEERRSQSPKLSTAYALADALEMDINELMGLPKRPKLVAELVAFLEQFDEAQQARLLAALEAFPAPRSE